MQAGARSTDSKVTTRMAASSRGTAGCYPTRDPLASPSLAPTGAAGAYTMAKIAIIGAGQAGLLAAHALRRRGYEVSLYSDKTPEDFLARSRPTGTAGRFPMALDFERELGLERWGQAAPPIQGIHL